MGWITANQELIFGLAVMGGYIAIVLIGVNEEPPKESLELIKYAMVGVGPILTLAGQAIFNRKRD